MSHGVGEAGKGSVRAQLADEKLTWNIQVRIKQGIDRNLGSDSPVHVEASWLGEWGGGDPWKLKRQEGARADCASGTPAIS